MFIIIGDQDVGSAARQASVGRLRGCSIAVVVWMRAAAALPAIKSIEIHKHGPLMPVRRCMLTSPPKELEGRCVYTLYIRPSMQLNVFVVKRFAERSYIWASVLVERWEPSILDRQERLFVMRVMYTIETHDHNEPTPGPWAGGVGLGAAG